MTAESPPALSSAILVVDDDPDIGISLTDLLEREGHYVEVVGTGAEAIERVQQHHFDAVLLDIGLPDKDGLMVLGEIVEVKPQLSVIILTAYSSLERTVGPLDLQGAFGYLTKPYDREEIKSIIRKAVGVSNLACRADRTQRALSGSEIRFRSVIESTPDAVIQADEDGMIISWNRAAQFHFGYAENEIIGKPLTMLMPYSYRDAHQRGLERMKLTSETRVMGRTVELEALRKDGRVFPIELSLGTWSNDSKTFFCGIIRDISERKHTEKALRHRIDLERLVATLSTRFINLAPTSVDDAIIGALGEIGEFAGADHSHVSLFPEYPNTVPNTYEWFSERIAPHIQRLQKLANKFSPWILDQIKNNETVHVTRVADLPQQADPERVEFQKRGIQSLLNVPMVCRGTVVGFLGFDAMRSGISWYEEDITLLKTVGEIFVNAIERKRVEETLWKNEELLGNIINNTTAVIYVKWADGRYRLVNRQYENLFHITHEEIQDRTDYDVFPKHIADAFRANDAEVLRTGTVLEIEEQAPHPDGLHTYISIKFPLFDQTGTPYATGGISTDITERKHAQEVLQHAYQEVGTILTNLPTPVFIVNNEGRVVYANTLAAQQYHQQEHSCLNRFIHEVLPFTPTQWNQLVADFRQVIGEGQAYQGEGEFQLEDLTYRYRLFPVVLPNSETFETGLALWDTTESKQLQDQLIQSEKLSSLGTVVSGMAHEISNPMQAIWGLAELLSEESDPKMIKELAGDLQRIGKHTTNVLRDFMAYVRPSSNANEIEIDLNDRLIEAVKMVQRGPHFGHVEVITEFQSIPGISARRAEIDQAFINLISNAVQAMEGKGRLILATQSDERLITARITDTGPGIPQSKLQKIFDPFFTTKSAGKGTGLGLSIVHKIVTRYGGTITVQSQEMQGTSFTIKFPVNLAAGDACDARDDTHVNKREET